MLGESMICDGFALHGNDLRWKLIAKSRNGNTWLRNGIAGTSIAPGRTAKASP